MPVRFAFWRREEAEEEAGEQHASAGWLSDFILGAQDGLVNVLGVILGVAAASQDLRIILAGGFAATFAESISMGAVAYTSTLARRDHYESEVAREMREMEEMPEAEREEVREILREWGYEGDELERLLDMLVAKPKAWLELMMAHELRLAPVEDAAPRRSALLVGVSAIVGSLIPLAPFLVPGVEVLDGSVVSLAVSGAALFAIGYYKAHRTTGRRHRSGLQMLVIGIASALAGFAVGYAFTVGGF